MATNVPPAAPLAAEPAPAAHPDLNRPPVGAPGGPPIPPTVPLTVDEYQRLRGLEQQFNEHQRAQQAALDAKEAERLEALAKKGDVEAALKQQRESWEAKHAEALARYNKLEQQILEERRATAISAAFTGRDFVGQTPEQRAATAAMLQRLIQDDFESVRDASGALVVREKGTGRPATEVLKAKLDSPEYALFFLPTARGGSGTDVSRAPAYPQTELKPGSVEAVAAAWRARQGQHESFGFGRGRKQH